LAKKKTAHEAIGVPNNTLIVQSSSFALINLAD
jgi:hypothetical protein